MKTLELELKKKLLIVDVPEKRIEDYCQNCKGKNPTWFAPSEIWKKLYPNEGIVCPNCFEEKAKLNGIDIIFRAEILNK